MGSLGRLLAFFGVEGVPMAPNSFVVLGGSFLEPDVPGSKINLRVIWGYHDSIFRSCGVIVGRKKLVLLFPLVIPGCFEHLVWS